MDDVDEEMPLNEATYVEDPLEFSEAIPQKPKWRKLQRMPDVNTWLRSTKIPETSPNKDPSPVRSTMRKCPSSQPFISHSHEFILNTSRVYGNAAAGEFDIASPPDQRPATNGVLDDQLTGVSLSPQAEELDDVFFVPSTPEDEIPRAAPKTTLETVYPVTDAFVSPLPASPQVRSANPPQIPR